MRCSGGSCVSFPSPRQADMIYAREAGLTELLRVFQVEISEVGHETHPISADVCVSAPHIRGLPPADNLPVVIRNSSSTFCPTRASAILLLSRLHRGQQKAVFFFKDIFRQRTENRSLPRQGEAFRPIWRGYRAVSLKTCTRFGVCDPRQRIILGAPRTDG